MPQMAVMPATALCRTAGPVSMTRDAIRPAKSFWKKGQLWRTTCRWLCQRTILVTLTTIPAFEIRFWVAMAAGRANSTTSAMVASRVPLRARNVSRGVVVMARTSRPMNQGTEASSIATARPAAKRAAKSKRACPTKCQ